MPQALGHPVAFDDLGEVRQSVVDTDDVARGPRLLRSLNRLGVLCADMYQMDVRR